jgi:general secretion pathway protein H
MVVVVIIAIGASAASLGLGSLTKASLQSSCVRLVALTRYAYHRALTQGTTVRITFDLDNDTFAVSEAHGRVTLVHSDAPLRKAGENDDERAAQDTGAGVDPWEAARQRIEKPDALTPPRSPFSVLTGPSGKPMTRFQTQPVGDDIRIAKIAVAHESKPREEGKADLFFFQTGLTQHAVIQLIDRDDIIYSVEIHPLTGRGKIHNAPFEPEVLMDDPNQRNEEASELEDRL